MQPDPLLLVFLFIVGALGLVLVFAVMRLGLATRAAERRQREAGSEMAFLTAALEQTVSGLREQEQATKKCARASERLSEQIIASLASGLLLVDADGELRILNPAGRRLLGVDAREDAGSFRERLGRVAMPLVEAIDECLDGGHPIGRRTLKLHPPSGSNVATHLGVSISTLLDDDGAPHGAICLFADLAQDRVWRAPRKAQGAWLGLGRDGIGSPFGHIPSETESKFRRGEYRPRSHAPPRALPPDPLVPVLPDLTERDQGAHVRPPRSRRGAWGFPRAAATGLGALSPI